MTERLSLDVFSQLLAHIVFERVFFIRLTSPSELIVAFFLKFVASIAGAVANLTITQCNLFLNSFLYKRRR